MQTLLDGSMNNIFHQKEAEDTTRIFKLIWERQTDNAKTKTKNDKKTNIVFITQCDWATRNPQTRGWFGMVSRFCCGTCGVACVNTYAWYITSVENGHESWINTKTKIGRTHYIENTSNQKDTSDSIMCAWMLHRFYFICRIRHITDDR